MSNENDLSPREFLRQARFSPEQAEKRFRNARSHIENGLFISHSGLDYHRILDQIVHPVMYQLIESDWYFIHSRVSGGAAGYRQLVQAALNWCDKFMVVISERSIGNEWVLAEVEWAIEKARPILAVRLDEHGWPDITSRLNVRPEGLPVVPIFDFSSDIPRAQNELTNSLKELLVKFPHRLPISGSS